MPRACRLRRANPVTCDEPDQGLPPLSFCAKPNRWQIIEAKTGVGAVGVCELAQRIDRDVKMVHTDAQALVLCGLLTKDDSGKFVEVQT